MLHKWAGRLAGGFGRPMGMTGGGSFVKWTYRHISSARDEATLNDTMKIYIFDNYHNESIKLFDQWLSARNLLGYLQRVENAPQFHTLLNGGVTYHGVQPSQSHYYQVPLDIDMNNGEFVRRYHGTYFYALWNILIAGFMGSGVKGEGGDNHLPSSGIVYTAPNPDLAHTTHACPHQLFGNGFLYKVVLDLRVRKGRMYKCCNATDYDKCEEVYYSRDVHVADMWLFTDTHATRCDSRILEWDPKTRNYTSECCGSVACGWSRHRNHNAKRHHRPCA